MDDYVRAVSTGEKKSRNRLLFLVHQAAMDEGVDNATAVEIATRALAMAIDDGLVLTAQLRCGKR